jgi:DNA-binding protein H-NS
MIDFNDKNLDELNEIVAAANAAKETAKDREHTELLRMVDAVKEKAEALGIKARSLFVEAKAESVAKYRNPANPEETFSGRGPRPAWLKALLEGVEKKDIPAALKQYEI